MIDTATGKKELFVKMPEEDKLAPHYQVLEWSPSGDAVYLSYSSRTKWERGVSRYDVATRRIATVAISSRWSLPGPCPVAIFVTATPVPVST